MTNNSSERTLSFFHIVMINVIAVDSIRSLPLSAQFGFSLVFYYLIAAICFFIPSALIAAELGTGWPKKGGLYIWIREAFGPKWALVAIWLNWVYNLAWYPTIMALIAGTSAYLFSPELAKNPLYVTLLSLFLFWGATFLNCLGMKFSSFISTIGALVGTLLPMAIITLLAIMWIAQGNPSQISFSLADFLPTSDTRGELAFFSNILFGLIGLEMVATHAAEMKNPQHDYPKATLISAFIILFSMISSSLAIAVVVNRDQLSLVVGALQAFDIFFTTFHIPFLTPILALCMILGGLSAVSAWVIGPTKSLMVAGEDSRLPLLFTRINRHGVPVGALILQGSIVTLLTLPFVLMPTINSSFALLSIITAQLALIVYTLFFAAAIKLHHDKPEVERHFKVPGGSSGIWTVSSLGISICLIAIGIGFIPPLYLNIHSILLYECLLIGGMILLAALPLLIQHLATLSSRKS